MEKQIGAEAKLKAEVVGGKIKLSFDYDGKQVDGGAFIMSDSDMLIDAVVELFPEALKANVLVGAIVALVKSTLKGLIV